METFKINKDWMDTATDDQLKRIIIAYNDGQGDTHIDTLGDISELFEDNISNWEMLRIIYGEFGGNMTDAAYFDGEYKKIYWVDL